MFSRGAVNGAEINGFAINGGPFVLEADGEAAIALDGTPMTVRRAGVSTLMAIVVDGTAAPTRQTYLRGLGSAALNGLALAYRRIAAPAGTAAMAVSGELTPVRRATLRGSTAITIDALAELFWRYQLPAPKGRGIVVHPELRRFIVPAEAADPLRVVTVAPEERCIAVADDGRRIVVPQERSPDVMVLRDRRAMP